MRDTFTAKEVSRLAGFKSGLMLNYLEQSGTFSRERHGEPHHGKWREYTFRDLVILRAINRLLLLGARPKRIQQSMAAFAKFKDLPNDVDSLAAFARKSSLFVVTADSVFFCEPDELLDLSKNGQLAFSFMVDNKIALGPVAEAVKFYFQALDKNLPRNGSTLERVLKRSNYT
jgi:DNA-binding transcriptional MerR regulator